MLYLVADYSNSGCKEPCSVSLDEAQRFYDAKCQEEGVIPARLADVNYPTCICDGNFDDYLWIV